MAKSTLLYGPQGTGKNIIASQLARHLGLHMVIDHEYDCDGRTTWPAEGVLLIAMHPDHVRGFTGNHLHINDARRQLGLPAR